MELLLSRLIVVASSIIGAVSGSTSRQAALSYTNYAQASEQPVLGVGFDLTASYGSAAVSFPNGTIRTIIKISAEDGYNEVLHRLSLDSSTHLSPPYDNLGESWDDMPRQWLRKARKRIGLPASSDVRHLTRMLADLRASVEGQVGPISSAGVTTPHLVALYDEDLHDAFDYIGLRYLTFPVGSVGRNILYETSAAYAGYGFGLCADYTDREGCENELNHMSDVVVMAVLYTRSALTVSLSVLMSAYGLWEPPYRHVVDFELGYDAWNGIDDVEDDGGYWAKVKMRLDQIMVEFPLYDKPAKVMLMGDCVHDEMFQRTLLTALADQMEELPEILGTGSDVVAARGAAEMTKRLLYKPDETGLVWEL